MLNRLIKRLQQLTAKLNNFIKWGLSKSKLIAVVFAISRVESQIEQVKNEEKPMKELQGSEKQVKWAEKIRKRNLELVDSLIAIFAKKTLIQALQYEHSLVGEPLRKILKRSGFDKSIEEWEQYSNQDLHRQLLTKFKMFLEKQSSAKFWIEEGQYVLSHLLQIYCNKYLKKTQEN